MVPQNDDGRIDRLNSERRTASSRVSSCQSTVDSLDRQVGGKQSEIAFAQSFSDSFSADFTRIIGDVDEDAATVSTGLQSAIGDSAAAERVKKYNDDTKALVGGVLSQLSALIARLQREKDALSGQLRDARASLQSAKDRLSSIDRTLSESTRSEVGTGNGMGSVNR